jgi:hypothetical protein
LENHRSDQAWYPARHQELPAVYVNGRYHRLATYSGEAPFTGAELSYLSGRPPGPAPWHLWTATERWAAFVGDDGWGLGVWNPATTCFTGGFDGKPGTGGTADPSTGYIAPLRNEILDASIIYGYEYDLILGSLNEIRAHVYRREAGRRLPSWQFSQSREGWYYAGLQDGGWPIQGALKFEKPGPGGHLLSPLTFWTAQAAPKLRLKARCQGGEGTVRLFWRRLGEDRADPKSTCTVTLTPDGAPQERLVDLASQPEYRGALIQLILVPPPGRFELDSVALEPAQPE